MKVEVAIKFMTIYYMSVFSESLERIEISLAPYDFTETIRFNKTNKYIIISTGYSSP